ncbi:MAG: hypothetical protein ACRED5_00575 [Propylenella sp.]
MWRIFVPLRYLQIDHPEKRKFDIWLPFILGIVFWLPLLSDGFREDSLRGFEIVAKVSSFLGVLTGFFIAALAAVATFGKAEMDDPMPGDPPVRLEHHANKETYFEELSRRRFLSFLFGYLSFVTLGLYLAGLAYPLVDSYFITVYWPDLRVPSFCVFWIVYGFVLANVLSNTLLGLFYLTDRIHRPNKTVKWKDKAQASAPHL